MLSEGFCQKVHVLIKNECTLNECEMKWKPATFAWENCGKKHSAVIKVQCGREYGFSDKGIRGTELHNVSPNK